MNDARETDPATTALPEPDLPALSAASVLSSDGTWIGRVQDIYLADATGAVAAVSVALGRLGGRTVLVPAAALASPHPDADSRVHLLVDARAAREGLDAPDTLHAGPETLERALRALGIEGPGVV